MKIILLIFLSFIGSHAAETPQDNTKNPKPAEEKISELNQNKIFLEQQIAHLQETIRNDREESISTQMTLHEEESKFETTANLYNLSSEASAIESKINANQKKLKELQDKLQKNQQEIDNLSNKNPIPPQSIPSSPTQKDVKDEKPKKCGCGSK